MKSQQALAWLFIPLLLTALSVESSTMMELYPERETDLRVRPGREESFYDGVYVETLTWYWGYSSYWGWRWARGTSPDVKFANRTNQTQIILET